MGGLAAKKKKPLIISFLEEFTDLMVIILIVAAAIVALALISWVADSDVLPSFFEAVINRVRGFATQG